MTPVVLEAASAFAPSSPHPSPTQLTETHSVGLRSIEKRINAHACPTLWDHGINLAGTSNASDQFQFVRWNPNFTQVLVSATGRGEVWVDDKWVTMEPGWAYITPPGKLHAYHTAPGEKRWEVFWVTMPRTSPSPLPNVPDRPRLIETDAELFRATITGLCCETVGKADPAMLEHWAGLVRSLAARVAGAAPRDEVIDLLWKKVSVRLAHSWTLAELSATLGCSEEHLRRLCQRRYGCSPRKRLLSLRMQHASGLLTGTNLTIAAIAEQVGYENEFAFSNAFKRWSHGVPPSLYRRRALGAA